MLNNISIYNNNILKIIITLIINVIYILLFIYYISPYSAFWKKK